jgi:hypothetical protein
MHGMGNSLQSFFCNQFTSVDTNTISSVFDSDQCILQVIDEFLLSGSQLIHVFLFHGVGTVL